MRVAAVLALVPLGVTLAAGQAERQAPAAQAQQPPFRSAINFVRVDVYPTRDGRFVSGLQRDDFEVLEGGVVQNIESFQQVTIRPGGPKTARLEPGSRRDMLQAIADPGTRVFLVFLDAPHVSLEGSHAANSALIEFLERFLSDDDLIGFMTPAMGTSDVTFSRRTQAIEEGLKRNWDWGTQGSRTPRQDEREIQYEMCYPPTVSGDVAAKMIARKRERATLEGLEHTVQFLSTVREDRKAIIAVTGGWELFREDRDLMNLKTGERPGPIDPIAAGRDGQLTAKDKQDSSGTPSRSECDIDRIRLASINDERFLRELIDVANRGNTSFYMIDPSGLTGASSQKNSGMQMLAENTDGLAVFGTNDLQQGMKRIADDMSSYYLLGYYSSNAKADGSFRSIRVTVKQPGVEVRARRGYKAPTREEQTMAQHAAEAAAPGSPAAVTDALDALDRIRPDARFRINAVAGGAGGSAVTLWVAGEFQTAGWLNDASAGVKVDIEATDGSEGTTTALTLKANERTFLTSLTIPKARAESVDVRATIAPIEGKGVTRSELRVPISPSSPQALIFRRGPATANRWLPTADPRFSRTDRVRLEIPAAAEVKPGTGRVLGRNGQPLKVPVTVGERTDDSSRQRWITADVTLAPLAAGDYVIAVELNSPPRQQTSLTAIRVTR
jgi:VWFA-related protein